MNNDAILKDIDKMVESIDKTIEELDKKIHHSHWLILIMQYLVTLACIVGWLGYVFLVRYPGFFPGFFISFTLSTGVVQSFMRIIEENKSWKSYLKSHEEFSKNKQARRDFLVKQTTEEEPIGKN